MKFLRSMKYTHKYINLIKGNCVRERDVKIKDLIKIRAFIRLLYIAKVCKRNRLI